MDKTRDYDIEREMRLKIGSALRNARQDNSLSLVQAAEVMGSSMEGLSNVEDGQKIMNLIRFLQYSASIGARVELVSASGEKYDITAPPFTPKQKETRQQIREDCQKLEAARQWARSFDTPDGQKNDGVPTKKRRPRLPHP